MNKQLAAIIFLAVEIREKSWNNVDRYLRTIDDSCLFAAAAKGNPAVGRLVSLALSSWWNDTLDWAEENK